MPALAARLQAATASFTPVSQSPAPACTTITGLIATAIHLSLHYLRSGHPVRTTGSMRATRTRRITLANQYVDLHCFRRRRRSHLPLDSFLAVLAAKEWPWPSDEHYPAPHEMQERQRLIGRR